MNSLFGKKKTPERMCFHVCFISDDQVEIALREDELIICCLFCVCTDVGGRVNYICFFAEVMREQQRELNRTERSLDRDRQKLQQQEKQLVCVTLNVFYNV